MRLSTATQAVFGLVALAVSVLGADPASDVYDLGKDDFDSVVLKEDIILVEFFAPWYVTLISSGCLLHAGGRLEAAVERRDGRATHVTNSALLSSCKLTRFLNLRDYQVWTL